MAWNAHAILTVAGMYAADAAATKAGVPSLTLMEAAGWQITRALTRRFPRGRVLVLCGPGNNGGDGFVVARRLRRAGWPVRVALLGSRDRLTADAAAVAARWPDAVPPLEAVTAEEVARADVVVDALFGAGLTRPVDGVPARVLGWVRERARPVVAVDVPSGVDGDTGSEQGMVAPATLTVTFFRPKPAHLLLPGRDLCGDIVVSDIGIPDRVLAGRDTAPLAVNHPDLWRHHLPHAASALHKWSRGSAVIVGGEAMTGAARMAARGARRAGCGLVTVVAPAAALAQYRGGDPGLVTCDAAGVAAFWELLAEPRRTAVLVGPGNGVNNATRNHADEAVRSGKPCVLDADALTVFKSYPAALIRRLHDQCLLTPHDGEFARLFGDLEGDRLTRARTAAARSGAVVLLKGSDTVVAAPDGRAVINNNAPPSLATGGTGDVLAGLAVGLMAQGMPVFEAAAAAVWLHGACARQVGPGLLAEDLPDQIPAILERVAVNRGHHVNRIDRDRLSGA